MTTDDVVLQPAGPEDLTDCATLLARLLRLDGDALVRLQRGPDTVSVWARPLDVVVRREIAAWLSVADRTVSAAGLLTALDGSPAAVVLPAPRDAAWAVTLPPRSGWAELDVVPAEAFRGLAASAGRAVSAAADPAAAGEALLAQEALTVSDGAAEVAIAVRAVLVLNRLGFLGPAQGSDDVVRVACTPAWARLAARHGTVYQRRNAAAALGFA